MVAYFIGAWLRDVVGIVFNKRRTPSNNKLLFNSAIQLLTQRTIGPLFCALHNIQVPVSQETACSHMDGFTTEFQENDFLLAWMNQHKLHVKEHKHNPHIRLTLSCQQFLSPFHSLCQSNACQRFHPLAALTECQSCHQFFSLWFEGAHSVSPNHSPTPPIDTWATWLCPLAQVLMWISREFGWRWHDGQGTHWVPFCLTTCQQPPLKVCFLLYTPWLFEILISSPTLLSVISIIRSCDATLGYICVTEF